MNTSSTLPPFWETVRVPGMRWLDLWLYSAGAIELCKSIIARSPWRVHFALSKSCCLFSSVCAFLFLFSFDLASHSLRMKGSQSSTLNAMSGYNRIWTQRRLSTKRLAEYTPILSAGTKSVADILMKQISVIRGKRGNLSSKMNCFAALQCTRGCL